MSDGDDETTGRRLRPTPRRAQTQTERDLEGLRRIRAERLGRADREHAVPQRRPDDPDTGRTERIDQDPDLARLYARSEHNRELVQTTKRELTDMVLEVAGERPPAERLDKAERGLKFVRWVVTAIAIPVISTAVLVGKYLMQKARDDERLVIEREQDHKQVEANAAAIREVQDALKWIEYRRRDMPDPPVKKDDNKP